MSGFSELGAALGGMGQSGENAYQTGMLRGAQGADLLEQARQRRNQNLALAAITPEKVQAAMADPTGQASSDLGAALIQANRDPRQIAEYGKTEQGVGFRNQAWQRAMQPGASVASLNPMLAVIEGKPVAVTGVQGNTLINKYVDPNQQAAVGGNVPTAVGQSDIGRNLAAAGASNASAARQYAGIGADKAANHDIVADDSGILVNIDKLTGKSSQVLDAAGKPLKGSPKAGKRGDGTVPPSVYEAVLGKPLVTGQPNPLQLQFQSFMALHPEMTDIEGLRKFALASQNTPEGTTELSLGDGIPLNAAQVKADRSGAPVTDDEGNVIARPIKIIPSSLGEAMGAPSAGGAPGAKAIVRTGKQNGRKVVQYADGTIDYAD